MTSPSFWGCYKVNVVDVYRSSDIQFTLVPSRRKQQLRLRSTELTCETGVTLV